MNRISFLFTALALIMLSACQQNQNPDESTEGASDAAEGEVVESPAPDTDEPTYLGKYTLVGWEKDGEDKTTDCDKQTEWHFTEEKAEPLGDGTEVYKLLASAPEECEWYGFEAKYTVMEDGQLFISTTKVGGLGGNSNAGLFEVVESNENTLKIESLGTVYRLERK